MRDATKIARLPRFFCFIVIFTKTRLHPLGIKLEIAMKTTTFWTRPIRYGLAVLSLGGATLCGLAGWQLAAPLAAPTLFPFSETYTTKAIAATTDTERLKWSELAIKVSPARAENWTLLAYAYQMADHGFSPRAIDALRHSYIIGPLSPDAHEWRLSYIFNNWSLLPADLKLQAAQELTTYMTRTSGMSFFYQNLRKNVTDPQGRLMMATMIMSKQMQDKVDALAKKREATSASASS